MSFIQVKEKNLLNEKENKLTKFFSAVFYFRDLIKRTQINIIKNKIVPQFKANLKFQSFKILNRMSLII
jgi:hypothetical protein